MERVHIISESELSLLKEYLEQIDIENGSVMNNSSVEESVLNSSKTIAICVSKIQNLIHD